MEQFSFKTGNVPSFGELVNLLEEARPIAVVGGHSVSLSTSSVVTASNHESTTASTEDFQRESTETTGALQLEASLVEEASDPTS